MTSPTTVVFIGLTGSTGVCGALGDAQAAGIISRLMHWIGRVCEAHGGRVVKFPGDGDGVLASFQNGRRAVEAAAFMQRSHIERMQKWSKPMRMGLKIGIASDPVTEMNADAVNRASRLSELAGSGEIWIDEFLMAQLRAGAPTDAAVAPDALRYQALGAIGLRGTAQARPVFRIEWNTGQPAEAPAINGAPEDEKAASGRQASIALAWLATTKELAARELPLVIGRFSDGGFAVGDQRVSRQHARIEWLNGTFVLTDLSSFGSWVRFTESRGAALHLRRSQCVLHSRGEIALGAPFADYTVPVVAFDVRTAATPSAMLQSLIEAAVGH